MKLAALLLGFSFLSVTTFAQISGNMVYGESNGNFHTNAERVYLSDSTILIQANVLMNEMAESYVVTFGVAEASPSLIESNEKINKRIAAFISDVKKMGIAEKDLYVDMTTQNKIYDYKITEKLSEQYLKGFEVKKNIIIKLKDLKILEKMLVEAHKHQIYDLVKVDYIVNDMDAIYERLFKKASEVINKKKDLYVTATNMKLKKQSQIFGESFVSYYPSQLYKSYTPNSTTEVSIEDYFRKKDLRQSTTFYYNKLSNSGFNAIINPDIAEPAIEFVFKLEIKFEIEK